MVLYDLSRSAQREEKIKSKNKEQAMEEGFTFQIYITCSLFLLTPLQQPR